MTAPLSNAMRALSATRKVIVTFTQQPHCVHSITNADAHLSYNGCTRQITTVYPAREGTNNTFSRNAKLPSSALGIDVPSVASELKIELDLKVVLNLTHPRGIGKVVQLPLEFDLPSLDSRVFGRIDPRDWDSSTESVVTAMQTLRLNLDEDGTLMRTSLDTRQWINRFPVRAKR